MAEGGRFAIATGRALAAFDQSTRPLVPMNAPGVVCNGAALYDFQNGASICADALCWTRAPAGGAR